MAGRKPQTVSELKVKVDSLDAEARMAKKAEAKLTKETIDRLGRLALASGLGDVQIKDRELTAGFKDLAGRFH